MRRFFSFLIQFWKTQISPSSLIAPLDVITGALGAGPHLRANLAFLLDLQSGSSQGPEEIFFVGFVRFFLQYGFHQNLLGVLGEISEPSSDYSDGSRFKSWFGPSVDQSAATNEVARGGPHAWKVIPSKNPTRFTLLYQAPAGPKALRIAHDAIAETVEQQFSVKFNNGMLAYQPTLEGILRETLHLSFPVMNAEPIPVKARYVGAEDIQQIASEAPRETPPLLWESQFDLEEDTDSIVEEDSQFEFSQVETGDLQNSQAF
jgi:hypothetical protein